MITVASSKVDLVRRLINEQSELLKQGIAITGGDYMYRVKYEYSDLNSIKPQMIEEATKNTRTAAQKFASDSDSKLGKIKRASQGQFSISDRDEFTPYIKEGKSRNDNRLFFRRLGVINCRNDNRGCNRSVQRFSLASFSSWDMNRGGDKRKNVFSYSV